MTTDALTPAWTAHAVREHMPLAAYLTADSIIGPNLLTDHLRCDTTRETQTPPKPSRRDRRRRRG